MWVKSAKAYVHLSSQRSKDTSAQPPDLVGRCPLGKCPAQDMTKDLGNLSQPQVVAALPVSQTLPARKFMTDMQWTLSDITYPVSCAVLVTDG